MINKQNLWFITLFSLIIILGIYYVTVPSNIIATFSTNEEDAKSASIETTESDVLTALKVQDEEDVLNEIETEQKILLDSASTLEQKNDAYNNLQTINKKKGKQEKIVKLIKETYNIESFVKIDKNNINVTLSSEDKGKDYANNVIKTVQSLYEKQMYITIKFQK